MNKVISINISGLLFNADEAAYDVLKKYLDDLKRHFSIVEGGDEILTDIEGRIAELLNERLGNRKEVISLADAQSVIEALGRPEELTGDEHTTEPGPEQQQSSAGEQQAYQQKRYFRDPDDRIFGGVCSGLSAYFGIDAIWVRLGFIFFLFTGFGILLYFAIWFLTPFARTSAEKLQMRGEKVNVSNIEKTVKDSMQNVKNRFQSWSEEVKELNTQERKQKVKDVANEIGNFIEALLKGLGGLFSGVVVGVSIAVFIAALFLLLGLGGYVDINIPPFIYTLFETPGQRLALIIGLGLVLMIPVMQMLYWALRRALRIKRRNRWISAGFTLAWITGIAFLAIAGISIARQFNEKRSMRETYALPAADTLYLEGRTVPENPMRVSNSVTIFSKPDPADMTDFALVKVEIHKTDEKQATLIWEVTSYGKSPKDAKAGVKTVLHNIKTEGNRIILDESFTLIPESRWRNQSVRLHFYLPEGKVVHLAPGTEYMLYDIRNRENYFDEDMAGHTWRMGREMLECTDCGGLVHE